MPKTSKSRKRYRRKNQKEDYGGISQEVKVDAALKKIVRVDRCTRAQIVKKIWRYIRRHKLQCPWDKRFFYPDEKLSCLVGPDENKRHNAFAMNKWIKSHISKITPEDEIESESDEEHEEEGKI